MNKYSIFSWFFLFILSILNLNAQIENQLQHFKVTHLTPDDGLSHSRVWKMLQDNQGFIWFATDYGLNKYDGYKFTVYKNNEKDSTSLAENFVWDMMLDKKGNIWLATNGSGFDIFDVKTERFIHHKKNPKNPNSLSNNEVRAFYANDKGKVWISCGITGGIIDCYDETSNDFKHYILPIKQKTQGQFRARTMVETKDGILWCGMSDGGLVRFNPENKQSTHYLPIPNDTNSLASRVVVTLHVDKNDKLWVCTSTSLSSYNPEIDGFKRYNNNDTLDGKRTYEGMSVDKNGNFWISSTKGLCFFNKQTNKFTNIYSEPNNPNSLMGNLMGGIFVDNSNIVWANVIGKGVDKIDLNAYKFRFYKHDPQNPASVTGNLIRGLTYDNKNNLWLALMNDGVDKLLNHKKIAHFSSTGNVNSLNENATTSVFFDSFGALWVGHFSYGLNRIEFAADYEQSKKYKVINYKTDRKLSKFPFWTVKGIIEDKAGTVWIGSELGIDKYDRKADKFIHYQSSTEKDALCDSRVQFLYVDSKGFLWIGTWDGVSRMIPSTNEFKKLSYEQRMEKFEKFISFRKNNDDTTSISNNKVISMCEAADGTFWFGTYGGGVNHLVKVPDNLNDVSQYKFERFNEQNGLANNVVFGIQEDNDRNMWFSTNNGLIKFDPKTRKFRVYTEKDGLQGNQFYWGASGKSKDGELLFGGTNGYNAFYPSEVRDVAFEPPIVITSFKINNEKVTVSSEQKKTPLLQNINLCDEIELSYLENSFSFEFASLHYTSPEDNRYAYQLEGFDKDWVQTDSKRRFANYTNIDAGTYYFKVKATNSDGVWKETPTTLKIVIYPPIWKTWWFRIGVVLFLAFLIYSFFKYRLGRIERQKQLLENLVETRTQEITQKNAVLEQQKEEILAQRDELEQRTIEITEQRNEIVLKHDELEQRNIAIMQQKEEIETQRDELEEKNAQIEEQNEFIKGSIRYAKNIQVATLPPKKLIDSYFESFILFRPKDIVSGDFYWFNTIAVDNQITHNPKEYIFLAVVDCTGHGVPGAFMSMLGIRLLNEIIIERRILTPADILHTLEKSVVASLRQTESQNADGMDICLCRLLETGDGNAKLMYAGAKRPLYYYSKTHNVMRLIDATHRSIGGVREYHTPTIFENVEIELSKGDILVLSSDGYQDQSNIDRKRIGSKKMFGVLQENIEKPMNEIKLSLETYLDNHKIGAEQRDDITVLGIKI